jgi:hypothetical protein
VDSIFIESGATVWAQSTADAPSALCPGASSVTGCRWCRRRGRQGSRVANRPGYRFTHDDAGVTSSSTFGWLVSWGGFSTRVPAAVTLCLMCRPPWRRFVVQRA